MGNIEVNYEQVHIKNHGVTVGVVGDLSAGEYEQWFYNAPNQNGAIYWDSQQADPVEIASGESICSVIPDSHISCLYYPQVYADNVYNQQCALDPLYDYGCDGWSDAYIEEYVEEEEPQVWEEVEEIEEVFVIEEPQVFEIIDIQPLENFTPATIEEALVEIETVFEEQAQEELIEELEAELEEFLEPEEEIVQEEQTTEEPQQEEVVVEVVEKPKLVETKKKASKKQKMREIISDKLKNLAVEMGEAASLEEQQKLQALILTLLNFNAGFNSYNTQLLVDGIFYEDKGIYLDKDIPDNKRGLRNGLANEILHNKLMDLQWQK